MNSLKCAGLAASVVSIMLAAGAAMAASADDALATQRLFEAIRANDMAAVQASLAAGADPDGSDRWGMKPIDLAVDKGYYRIAHVLAAARHVAHNGLAAASQHSAIVPASVSATSDAAPAQSASRNAASAHRSSAAAKRETSSRPATDDAVMVWPAGVPNPFDPSMPPPRSQLVTSSPGDGVVAQ